MTRSLKECLRRLAGRLAATGLRWRSRRYLPPPGLALVIAPHADDETLGCGGMIAARIRAGHATQVVFVTDGAASHPGHPRLCPEELVRQRRAEALAALAVLGVGPDRAHFLALADGSLGGLSPAGAHRLAERLAELIRRFRPVEVFTPWREDGSSEHAAVFAATLAALRATGGGTLMEYLVWAWWDPRRVLRRLGPGGGRRRLALGPVRALKERALACHHTQVAAVAPWTEPVLPPAVARACCGPVEFFFQSRIPGQLA